MEIFLLQDLYVRNSILVCSLHVFSFFTTLLLWQKIHAIRAEILCKRTFFFKVSFKKMTIQAGKWDVWVGVNVAVNYGLFT